MTDAYSYQQSGKTIKFIYRDVNTRQVWNITLNAGVGGYEVWNNTNYNLGQYFIPTTEEGASAYYVATRPAGIVVPFAVDVILIVDGTLANDQKIASGEEFEDDVDVVAGVPATTANILTIDYTLTRNGSPYDATSVTLESRPDISPAYGLKRVDTGGILVPTGGAFTHVGTGLYQYPLIEPGPGLVYDYWLKVVVDGQTFYKNKQKAGSADPIGYYTNRGAIAVVIGDKNLILWSQLSDEDANDSPNNVVLRGVLHRVDNYFNRRLREGNYTWPLNPNSQDFAYICDLAAQKAAVYLYRGRPETMTDIGQDVAGRMRNLDEATESELTRMIANGIDATWLIADQGGISVIPIPHYSSPLFGPRHQYQLGEL